MDTLPLHVPVIDENWKSRGDGARWERLDAKDRSLLEEHVDALVCSHVDVLAESLQGADVLEEGTQLLVLGTQVDNVDVVLAEVDAEDRAFRRLVLVENKLLRNPQSKRSVLAQIVEYGHTAQRTWPAIPPPQLFKKADRAWLDQHHSELLDSLRRGEYLLLIVGDRIDGNLARLARRFIAQESPVNLSELAVVSLGLYRRGAERLVIPHVVSAVTVGERPITIQVMVDGAGAAQVATVTARTDIHLRSKEEGAPEGAKDFLKKVARFLDPDMEPHGWCLTKEPRKQLAYTAEYDDADPGGKAGTRPWYVVHFGGYGPEWRPLLVGLELMAKNTAARDVFKAEFDRLFASRRLPEGTRVTLNGPLTVKVVNHVPWEHPAELNDALVERVVNVFRQIVEVLTPVLERDDPPPPA